MFTVITVSDRCSEGTQTDLSGPVLVKLVEKYLKSKQINHITIPDEEELIKNSLIYHSDVLKVNGIFTTGGTGFTPRDVTPEATRAVLTKEAPQLALAMTLESLKKTKFAVLSRSICGMRNSTLIVNFPGSKKAVEECFMSIADVLPHALHQLNNDFEKVSETHKIVHSDGAPSSDFPHICPHQTASGDTNERHSTFSMIDVEDALKEILEPIESSQPKLVSSTVNIPPFRASIKDGYAVKIGCGRGIRRVLGYISAGDPVIETDFNADSCYKINTGAPVPDFAEAIIQIEDTKLVTTENDKEVEVEILVDPLLNLDIRSIGSDLKIGEKLFDYMHPLSVGQKSLLASIGEPAHEIHLKIGIISTGDELVDPYGKHEKVYSKQGKIFDSNTTMLRELLKSFGFGESITTEKVVKDDYNSLKKDIEKMTKDCHVIICTGGVSMGDKDYVKAVLKDLDYEIVFGRVNMKPGKPLTFGTFQGIHGTKFFGLPGNPVSAFVTFHLFVLPTIRKMLNTINKTFIADFKCHLPTINVELMTKKYDLDPRPEYARAMIISKNGKLYAEITGRQISSRLKSIIDADVLLHLPARTSELPFISQGAQIKATVLKIDFVTKYED